MRSDMSEIADHSAARDVAQSRRRAPAPSRYQLDVIGSQVADVVDAAGGWLFDRVMAGWDVNVAVPEECDVRPLQILGVRTVSMDAILADANTSTSSALAVSGRLCSYDDRITEAVAAAVRSGRREVTVWGELWVTALRRRGEQVRHELSAAARAFKAHAVASAGVGQRAMAGFEAFRSHGLWGG